MKNRVLNALNIKASESAYIFDLLRVQIFIGLAISYVNIIAYTLFLKTLSIQLLPYAYLTIAPFLLLLNVAYEKLEHRTSPLRQLKYIIIFSLVILICLWLGLSWGHQQYFIFALMVWSVLFYMLNGYAYWGIVSLLFNIRESKRVFSIVGAGDIPAKLIGYLSAPILIAFFGLTNLLWMSVISLLIGLWFFHVAIQKTNWEAIKHSNNADHHVIDLQQDKHKKGLMDSFFKNELIFAISILSILSYNVFSLIDFTFLSHVKHKYEDLTSLAAFLAAFFAVGRIIALVFKLLITSRVIERWGIVICLFITPAILFFFSLVFFAMDQQSEYILYVFGMMVLITEVLRSAMQEPIFFILFQPLKEKIRLHGHLITKGYMLPPSLITVGLSLIILNKLGVDVNILLTIKIVLINLVAWAVAIFYVKRAYLRTLHRSISKGIFNSDEVYLNDQKSIDILLNKISNGKKSEIIYALKLLGKANHPDFVNLLYQQLYKEDKEVKMYVLSELSKIKKPDIDMLKQLAEREEDSEIKQSLTSIICRNDKAYLNMLSEKIEHLEYGVRKVVIISLLNQDEFDHLFKAGNELNNLIQSPVPEERELAIHIISELKNVRFTNAIEQLINDDDLSVKRNAIMVACKLKVKNILPDILGMLSSPSGKYIALQGLLQYGDDLFADIEPSVINDYTAELVGLAGKMKGVQSTNFLLMHLSTSPDWINKIVHALWRKEYRPSTSNETGLINHVLDDRFLSAKDKIDCFYAIQSFKNHVLVKNSLRSEIQNDLETCMRLCCLLYDKHEINRILELLETGDTSKLYNAMEMLELVLPQRVIRELNMLFDHFIDPNDTRKIHKKQEVNHLFDKIVFTNANEFNPWTKAVSIYSLWQNKDYDFIRKLSVNPTTSHSQPYVMQETTTYVLNALT